MKKRIFSLFVIVAISLMIGITIGQVTISKKESRKLRDVTYQRYVELLEKGLIAHVIIYEPCNYIKADLIVGGERKTITIYPPFKKAHLELLEDLKISHEIKSTLTDDPSDGTEYPTFCPRSITDIDYVYFLQEIRSGSVISILLNLKDGESTPIVFGKIRDENGEYEFRVNTAYPDNIAIDSTYLEEIEKYNEGRSSFKIAVTEINQVTKDSTDPVLKFLLGLSVVAAIGIPILIALSLKKRRSLAIEDFTKDSEVIESLEIGTDTALESAGVKIIKGPRGVELSRVAKILATIQEEKNQTLRHLLLLFTRIKAYLEESLAKVKKPFDKTQDK
ncbi:MAG: hypothetical protein AAB884_00045 [Patescibacteria group bacterium]